MNKIVTESLGRVISKSPKPFKGFTETCSFREIDLRFLNRLSRDFRKSVAGEPPLDSEEKKIRLSNVKSKKALILLNNKEHFNVSFLIDKNTSHVIYSDGGFNHKRYYGLKKNFLMKYPLKQILIGDFDSFNNRNIQLDPKKEKLEVIHVHDFNSTDFGKALTYTTENVFQGEEDGGEDCDNFVICTGVLSTDRFDHAM